jgi:hypothetical protein
MKRVLIVFAMAIAALSLSLNAAQAKPMLSKEQAKALVASAKTAADHLQLAAYYNQQAEAFLAEADEHQQMLAGYKSNPMYAASKYKAATLDHCEYLVKSSRANAAKMKDLAALHEKMALQLKAK